MALRSVSTLLETVGDAVWRADALACASGAVLFSGHTQLDAQLPGGGWPVGALCEILQKQPGQHEWRLLLPVLRHVTQVHKHGKSLATRGQLGYSPARQVVLIGAPWTPFAPGLAGQGLDARTLLWVQADHLAERLWAAEQALRCTSVTALLLWLHDAPARGAAPRVRAEHLRRLHLGAQAHAKLLFVMRTADAQFESSPAALRLLLESVAPLRSSSLPCASIWPRLSAAPADDLQVQILKRRGPPLMQTLRLPARHATLAELLALSTTPRHMRMSDMEPRYALDCAAATA